jgi:hypothetical protein
MSRRESVVRKLWKQMRGGWKGPAVMFLLRILRNDDFDDWQDTNRLSSIERILHKFTDCCK